MMLARSHDAGVQGEGCEVLATLSHHKHLHRAMIQQGVVGVLLSTVLSPEDRVRTVSAKGLSHLSSAPDVREAIVRDRGMARIIASVKGEQPSDPFTAYLKLIARE